MENIKEYTARKKAELKKEECNILCSNTPDNVKKIKPRINNI